MMKRMVQLMILGAVGLLTAIAAPHAERFIAATGPDSVRGYVELRGAARRPVVNLSWVDTSNALVLTEILRRGPSPDSAFRRIGVVWLDDSTKVGFSTLTQRHFFTDLYPSRGTAYGYRLQDSIRGVAQRLVMPSDTLHITVP